ncbi:MAG: hypothetical protein E7632_08145 [Ruminococcaceae bacterium]|nr:hypothetical protein [Oscillospiraceae bacterium]
MRRGILICLAGILLVLLCACEAAVQDTPAEQPDFSQYIIVRSDYADKEETAPSIALKKYFDEHRSLDLKLGTDWESDSATAPACEILMGETNRDEYAQFVGKLKQPGESCAYGMVGEKVIFYAATLDGMMQIVDKFAADVLVGAKTALTDGVVYEYTYSEVLKQVNGEEPMSSLKDTILWGVNAHHKGFVVYQEHMAKEHVRLAAEMGSTIYRINFNPTTEEDVTYISQIADWCHEYGMKVMLVLDRFTGTNEEIAARMTFTAEHLADKFDYFQIFNETDIWASKTDDGSYYNITNWSGMTTDYYNPERVKICVERMTAALTAFKAAAPEAKVVINIGERHYPILDWYIEAGLSWDVIGFDIYLLDAWDHHAFFREMEERYPGYDFMVTECNYPALKGPYTEGQQVQWLRNFLKTMNEYDSDRLIGVMIYELLDQPNLQTDDKWYGEAHFGLINVNADYSIGEPKPSYREVQSLLCGGEAKLTMEFKPVE